MVINKHGKYYNRIFKIDLSCDRCGCEFTIFGEWDVRRGGDYYFPDITEQGRGYNKIVYCPDCGAEIDVEDKEPEITNELESIDTALKSENVNEDSLTNLEVFW